jgi:predicted anti-sigma-YlaC factor YlaD
MRWKLVVLVSIVAALVASLSWFGLIILFFKGSGSFWPLDPGLWPLSLVLPFLLAIFGGFFIYRHTSRQRKTQAVITFVAVLILTTLVCFAVMKLLPFRRTIS